MDCDVCIRPFNGRRKPSCPSCIQATQYEHRVRQITSLLAREKSHSQAEAILRPGNDGVLAALPDDIDFDAITTGMKKHSFERCKAEQRTAKERIDAIASKAELLRKQIEGYRASIADYKQDMVHRRKFLSKEVKELEKLKPRMMEPIQIAIRKTSQRLEKISDKMIDSRSLLCHEAALACGLYLRRGSKDKIEYVMGGIVIPDLRELGMRSRSQASGHTSSSRTLAEPHALITASLDDIARFLSITAHYLSVRLPAEIVLPRGDSPRCVIMPERSSYRFSDISPVGQVSSQTNSPAASKIVDPVLPRPRPLFLDYPLAQLSKEDPKSYGLFVEGVALLAWDLAWLCRTQGIDNINTFEEFCMIGKNLWQLIVTQSRMLSKPSLDRKVSTTSDRGQYTKNSSPIQFGLFSHASASRNLAGADAMEISRDWKLASPARVTDKLKTFLLTEIQGAEWDLLEEQEWTQEREDEKPVLVGGSRRPQDSRHAAMSVMTVATHDSDKDENATGYDDRKKGSNGWMKVRGRTEEV